MRVRRLKEGREGKRGTNGEEGHARKGESQRTVAAGGSSDVDGGVVLLADLQEEDEVSTNVAFSFKSSRKRGRATNRSSVRLSCGEIRRRAC